MHTPKFSRDYFFYRTTPAVSFEVSFNIRKEFLKTKVNGEIAFALISLFHVQIQEPASRSTTTRTFVFLAKFIITKYLKQEVHDDLSICVDERSPSGLSITGDITDLTMSRDLKEITLLPPMEKCPMDFYQGVVFTAQI